MNKSLKVLSSLTLTTICLMALGLLIFVGTLAQSQYGLYAAQQKYFYSWFFLVKPYDAWIGFPFPGALSWCALFTINLSVSLWQRFLHRKVRIGLLVSHLGMWLLMVGAGASFLLSKEFYLDIGEGEVSSQLKAYSEWELAIAEEQNSSERLINARSLAELPLGEWISFGEVELNLEAFFPNAKLLAKKHGASKETLVEIVEEPAQKEPQANTPGVRILARHKEKAMGRFVLHGAGSNNYTSLESTQFSIVLRPVHHPLEFSFKLIDFQRETYPGTTLPKKFVSILELNEKGDSRRVQIQMNEPLRLGNWTFFQAAFTEAESGQRSTLAAVYNPVKWFPYLASFVVCLGLCIHFVSKWKTSLRRARK